MKNKLKVLLIAFVALMLLSCLCGCQTVEKTSYFNHSFLPDATFEYNAETNVTYIKFKTTLTNESIYNFDEFKVTFNLYNGTDLLKEETVYYTRTVKHGQHYTGNFTFDVEGQFDKLSFVSWNAHYLTVWQTYKAWFIVCIVILALGTVVYVAFMIIEDLEAFDFFEGIGEIFDSVVWLPALLIPLLAITNVIPIVYGNWVISLIMVGTLVAFFVLAMLAHFVKFVVESICDNVGFAGDAQGDDEDDYFDNQMENVADHLDNEEMLSLFTKDQLKEYCKESGLTGYSKLTKDELVWFVMDEAKSKKKKPTNDKKPKETKPAKHVDSLAELDKLIGLESVKTQVKRIRAILLKNKDSGEQPNLHMCFYGNPGTGKTVVARLIANILYETGVLPTNKLVETDRSGLCGQYVGQTGPLTHKKVKEAMGGVLFIDEAYTLCADGSGEDYGKEAIAALLKDMEDYKGKFCVILAGYKEEMEQMIALNPGFDSRINRKINFSNYSIEELMQIFDLMIAGKKYQIDDDAKQKIVEILQQKSQSNRFANARTVRNVLDGLIEIQAVRTLEDDDSQNDTERVIRLVDVAQYTQEN